jgi:hypothetical protein
VEQNVVVIARLWYGKHVFAATDQDATIEAPWEAVFSVWFTPGLYSKDRREKSVSQKLESVVSSLELQVSSDGLWLVVRNLSF